MNGELLEPGHGYPLRLFVPGWYGVASVKWLRRIEVIDRPFRGLLPDDEVHRPAADGAGHGNGDRRADGGEVGDHPAARRRGARARHEPAVRRRLGRRGGGGTRRGQHRRRPTWTRGEPDRPNRPLFVDAVGVPVGSRPSRAIYTLLARATSASGQMQPLEHDPLNGGYLIHLQPGRRVRVDGTAQPVTRPGDADRCLRHERLCRGEHARSARRRSGVLGRRRDLIDPTTLNRTLHARELRSHFAGRSTTTSPRPSAIRRSFVCAALSAMPARRSSPSSRTSTRSGRSRTASAWP